MATVRTVNKADYRGAPLGNAGLRERRIRRASRLPEGQTQADVVLPEAGDDGTDEATPLDSPAAVGNDLPLDRFTRHVLRSAQAGVDLGWVADWPKERPAENASDAPDDSFFSFPERAMAKRTAAQVASAEMNAARQDKLTPEKRQEIAAAAAAARWSDKSPAEKAKIMATVRAGRKKKAKS